MIYCWDSYKIFQWVKEGGVSKSIEEKTGHMLVIGEVG